MKNLAFSILALLMMTTTAQAQWFGGKKIKGNGERVTIERTTGNYDGVSVAGSFDIKLVKGKEGKLSITGDSNLLKHVTTEIKRGKLIIDSEDGYNLSYRKSIVVTVPVESVESLSVSGSGEIVGDFKLNERNMDLRVSGSGDMNLDLDVNSVDATVTGSGEINLNGKASKAKFRVTGSGEVSARSMKVDDADVTVTGSGDVSLTVTGTLEARVTGSGDITYYGNPAKTDFKTTGSGDIERGR